MVRTIVPKDKHNSVSLFGYRFSMFVGGFPCTVPNRTCIFPNSGVMFKKATIGLHSVPICS